MHPGEEFRAPQLLTGGKGAFISFSLRRDRNCLILAPKISQEFAMTLSAECRRPMLVGLFLCLADVLLAQTAQITGRISDPSGAVIPGADVTITNTQTGIQRGIASNEHGYYTMPLLPRGVYTVAVELKGFKSVRQAGIELDEGQVQRLDFTLQVGQLTETIEVTGRAPLIDASTSQVSTVIPKERILELPMLNRNALTLALLAPGMRAMGDFAGLPISSYDGSRVSISGGPSSANNFMLDGTAAEMFSSGGLNVIPSVDAMEEFRIVARNPSAEFGRTGGGIINIISKSGTNEFHGSAYEFLRNKVLEANGYNSNRTGTPRAAHTFNEYGATLGGPIKKDRTFFFFNWEQFRDRTHPRALYTVPSASQRTGDFSDLMNSSGKQVVIYDPYTTRLTGSGTRSRDPFAGNVIPPSRVHPVAKALATFWPQPNLPGREYTQAQNYQGEGLSR